MPALDPRIVRVGIEIGGKLKIFEDMFITVSGAKYANPLANECEVKIANLAAEDQAYILTETSPYNRSRKRKMVRVWAGRKSYGVKMIYSGDIVASSVTQPPDVTLSLKCRTGYFIKGLLISQSSAGIAPLSSIAGTAAQTLGLSLDWQATDKNVSNYQFTGSGGKQLEDLQNMGAVDVYMDDDTIVVKDKNAPLKNAESILSEETGMVGVPEMTDRGVRVKYMLDRTSRVGARLNINSKINPAANGISTIYKLGFEIASREVPFYYIAETLKYGRLPGAI